MSHGLKQVSQEHFVIIFITITNFEIYADIINHQNN